MSTNLKGAFWTKKSSFQPKAKFRFFVTIDGLQHEDYRTKGEGDTIINRGDAFADSPEDTNIVWYAKSIDKPGYQFADVYPDNYYPYGASSPLKAPAAKTPKFKMPLKMTLVDPTYPNLTRKLLRWLRRTGYNDTKAREAMIARQAGDEPAAELFQTIGKVRIYQLSPSINNTIDDALLRMETLNPDDPFEGDPGVLIKGEAKILEIWELHQAYPIRIDFGNLDYSSSDPVEIQIDWVYTNFTCDMKSIMIEDNKELDFLYFRDFVPSDLEKPNSELTCKERFDKYKKMHPSKTWDNFLALQENADCKDADE